MDKALDEQANKILKDVDLKHGACWTLWGSVVTALEHQALLEL